MDILGISCFYHDSAACLVSNGRIIAAAQEERFTRRKHDPRFPEANWFNTNLTPADYSFGSKHPGGAQFVLGDASVTFIQDSIDSVLYGYLANISDGEAVTVP